MKGSVQEQHIYVHLHLQHIYVHLYLQHIYVHLHLQHIYVHLRCICCPYDFRALPNDFDILAKLKYYFYHFLSMLNF